MLKIWLIFLCNFEWVASIIALTCMYYVCELPHSKLSYPWSNIWIKQTWHLIIFWSDWNYPFLGFNWRRVIIHLIVGRKTHFIIELISFFVKETKYIKFKTAFISHLMQNCKLTDSCHIPEAIFESNKTELLMHLQQQTSYTSPIIPTKICGYKLNTLSGMFQ